MRIWKNNGLSMVVFALFLAFWAGQSVAGHRVTVDEFREHGEAGPSYLEYLASPDFAEATFENWESEFLQMAAYVFLTVFLYQKGSSESKDPDKPEEVDADPRRVKDKRDAPGPVRRGGVILRLYENSLSLALLALFLVSFVGHARGGAAHYNEEQLQHGGSTVDTLQYMGTSQFWFESLQNWQSEFLAVFAIVVLSIFLRQRGSPESKPVAAPHGETGA